MKIVFILLLFSTESLSLNRWPNHDITTLKLLQIVHRHGDRTPDSFTPNDPLQNESYWPEGIGELTDKGKYRLYKTGQFIRQEYQQYLGEHYSPREVYARSSVVSRCIESVSCLLSGAYPPNNKEWKWSNGTDAQLGNVWQPIPIETFMPVEEDVVLANKYCPKVDSERVKIFNRTDVRKYNSDNQQFFSNLTKITGKKINDLVSAGVILSTLQIEIDRKFYWNKYWTKEEEMNAMNKLSECLKMGYHYYWDSPVIQRLTSGGLVKELNKNYKSVLNNENKKKLFVYSTHDTVLAPLMYSLNIFNDISVPFGATLLLELHQKKDSKGKTSDYFVRAFYHNETVVNTGTPHPIQWKNCGNLFDCPFDQYFNSTKHLIYKDFDKECNQTDND